MAPIRSWTQSRNRHRRWVGLPINGSTRLQRPSVSVEKIVIVTPVILRTLGCESDCRCALTYTKPLTDGMSACVRYPLCSDTFRCKDSFCLCCYLGAPLEWKPRQTVCTSHTSAKGLSTIWVIATSDATDRYDGEYLGTR